MAWFWIIPAGLLGGIFLLLAALSISKNDDGSEKSTYEILRDSGGLW